MLKALIVIGLCAAAFWVGQLIFDEWKSVETPTIKPKFVQEYEVELDDTEDGSSASSGRSASSSSRPAYTPSASSSLPGLPKALESGLASAKRDGVKAFKYWLQNNRKRIQDPRLAAIELDYVVMVAFEDIVEAKRLFARVKKRIDSSSPVYPRLKALEDTYQ